MVKNHHLLLNCNVHNRTYASFFHTTQMPEKHTRPALGYIASKQPGASTSTSNLSAGTILQPQSAAAKPPAKEIGTKQRKQQQQRQLTSEPLKTKDKVHDSNTKGPLQLVVLHQAVQMEVRLEGVCKR